MISADDIKLLISSGEGYNAEFKINIPAKVKELTEVVCAFANAAGGVLLIGVNDNNVIEGFQFDNKKRSAIQNSFNEITPQLSCSLTTMEVDEKVVGVIEVPSGPRKPYVLSGAIYVRVGPNTQKLTSAEQMRDFFQRSDKLYFDEVPCPDFDINTMVDEEFISIFKAESKISQGISKGQLFSNLRLFAKGHAFKNGSVLFFASQPELFHNHARIRCVTFQGIDKRFITDYKFFGGNLYNQYLQTMGWLGSKLNIRYDIEGQGGGPRKEFWEIPETIFKESIINALSHRDYNDKGGVINVEIFDDRVEISNPGGLVSAIPESEFGKRSHTRNPLLFGLFARMQLVEQVGSGIGRIQYLMRATGLAEPIFKTEGTFLVVLKRPGDPIDRNNLLSHGDGSEKGSEKSSEKGSEKRSEKSSEKILELLKKNPELTIQELSVILSKSTRQIEKHLFALKKRRKISRIGPDKGGYWKIIEADNNN